MQRAAESEATYAVIRRHRGLFLRTALVSGLTLVSRLLGFARESLSAVLFGDSSAVYDAFVTAWRVPNLFRRLLGEGALATSLQNAMTEADHDGGDAAGTRVFHATLRWAAVVLVAICALVMLAVGFLPDRMPLTGWQWLGDDPEPVRELCVRLMPFVVLICLAALASGALNVRGHYLATVLAPIALNAVWIAALVGLGLSFGWTAAVEGAAEYARHFDMARVLGWGVLVAGVVNLAVLVPALARRGLLGASSAAELGRQPVAGVGLVLRGALPLALGAAVYQINVMVDGFMAEALLSDGGPTTLYLANRIQQLPMGLVAVAAMSAVFPALKAFAHTGEHAELRRLHDQTHLAIVFFALPASVGLFALAEPIVAVLLQHGEFSAEGVARTALALRLLALSLVPAGAASLCSRAFIALGDAATPVRVSIAMLIANIALNTTFVAGLGMDIEGLALGTVVTSWLNVVILLPLLLRRLPAPATELAVASRLAKTSAAALLTGGAAAGAHSLVSSDPRSAIALAAALAAGALAFAGSAAALGLPECRRFTAPLRRLAARRPR